LGSVFKSNQPVIVNDPTSNPDRVGVPDGHPPIISFLGVPLKQGGRTIGIIATANKESGYGLIDQHDIETLSIAFVEALMRKRAEKLSQQSEERFRHLYDEAPVGYHEVDIEGHIIKVNRTELEMLGCTEEEMLGQFVWKFNADEQITRQRVMAKIAGAIPPGRAFERTYKRKDGTTLPVLIEDRLLQNEEGRIIGMRSTIQDITERQQAEEALRRSEAKFKRLFDEAPVGYVELDTEGRITQVNRTELTMLGYTAEEMIGQAIWKFNVEEEKARQTVMAKLSGIMPTGKPFERTYKRKDGTSLRILIDDSVIRDAEGSITGIHAVIQDVTERKRAEEEMANLQEQLRQSQKMEAVGQLAGGIAHDFNNLLTVIKGYSQLSLLELKEGDPLKANIEEIQKASQRAADLTRQLLAFSRRQILDIKVLNLNTILQDLDRMLHRILGEDIELIYGLAEDLGKVKTDPGQIEQVIMNLAVNARDAMLSGGKLIIETANLELDETYARTHIGATPGHYVMVSVSDTGCGMSSEVKERIFEPFFTTKEKGKGTGLGLSTVYGIVKQSGGYIWVYSEPGCGTTFKIYVPRVEDESSDLDHKEDTAHSLFGGETILLVEDEPSVRGLAVRVLREQGYTLLEASNGDEALRIFQEQKDKKISLLMTDVVMPQMGGKELSNRLKILQSDIKVLFISGYTDDAIVHRGVLEPGTNFLQKPFSPAALAHKVRDVLDG